MPSTILNLGILLLFQASAATSENELPFVDAGNWPYVQKHVGSIIDGMAKLGAPLADADGMRVRMLLDGKGTADELRELQQILDRRALVGVNVNPESRVKAQRGPAAARLE